MPIRVNTIRRIIVAVCKHIKSGKALPGAGVAIRVDKSADFGVVVAGLEIIETRFGVVIVTTITERVNLCEVTCCGNDFAVWVVVIGCDLNATCIG